MQRVEHRRGKDDWETPPEIFGPLDAEFGFTLDVCASHETTKCLHYHTKKGLWQKGSKEDYVWHLGDQDGLTAPWGTEVCWMNPPYSAWQKWVAKAAEEAKKGATVVALLPSRTDTRAFHDHIWGSMWNAPRYKVEVRFIKGRIKFVGAEHGAPFPSMVVVFWPNLPHKAYPDPLEDDLFRAPPLLSYSAKN